MNIYTSVLHRKILCHPSDTLSPLHLYRVKDAVLDVQNLRNSNVRTACTLCVPCSKGHPTCADRPADAALSLQSNFFEAT